MSDEMNLLTKEEAANLAGVGNDTIERYRDLGLLRKYVNNGEEKFSEDDIRLLFNAKIKQQKTVTTPSPNTSANPLSASDSSKKSVESTATTSPSETNKNIQSRQAEATQAPLQEASQNIVDDKAKLATNTLTERKSSAKESELPRLQDIIKEAEANILKSKKDAEVQFSKMKEHSAQTSDIEIQSELHIEQENTSSNKVQSSREPDITSIELLELSRTLKDQLQIVKEERNWLRKRIERLESLTERDQMLRMSESESLRALITQMSQKDTKKSPWSFLLGWTKPKTQAIEQKK